jgi:tight adherence protein B
MPLIIIFVSIAAFSVVALISSAATGSKTPKETRARLASVLKSRSATEEEIVDVRKEHRLSSIPWLHNLLSRIDLGLELRRILTQADLKWTPGKLILVSLALWVVAGYIVYLRTHVQVMALLAGTAAAAVPLVYVLRTRTRRLSRMQQKLPEALDLMVSAIRAGHSMGGALAAAAREAPEPIGREFRLCFEEQNFGIDLRTASQNLLERVPLDDLRIVTTAMLIHKESGGNLAEVLDKTANVIRERFRLQQQIRVHTAQGRLTGAVLILLPLAIGVILYMTNRPYITLLFTRSLGHRMLTIAAVMNVVGLLIIRKIINIRV